MVARIQHLILKTLATYCYILDAQGQPIPEPDLIKWAKWFDKSEHRIVAKTKVGDVRISTVFLACDHAFGNGPLILWEMMVFGGMLDEEQDRYSSLADARRGHEAMVAKVTQAEKGGDDA